MIFESTNNVVYVLKSVLLLEGHFKTAVRSVQILHDFKQNANITNKTFTGLLVITISGKLERGATTDPYIKQQQEKVIYIKWKKLSPQMWS